MSSTFPPTQPIAAVSRGLSESAPLRGATAAPMPQPLPYEGTSRHRGVAAGTGWQENTVLAW